MVAGKDFAPRVVPGGSRYSPSENTLSPPVTSRFDVSSSVCDDTPPIAKIRRRQARPVLGGNVPGVTVTVSKVGLPRPAISPGRPRQRPPGPWRPPAVARPQGKIAERGKAVPGDRVHRNRTARRPRPELPVHFSMTKFALFAPPSRSPPTKVRLAVQVIRQPTAGRHRPTAVGALAGINGR